MEKSRVTGQLVRGPVRWTLPSQSCSGPETESTRPACVLHRVCAAQRPVSRASFAPLAPCSPRPVLRAPRAPPAQRPAPTEQQQPVRPPQVAPLLAESAVDAPADPPGLALLRALPVRAPPPLLRRSQDRGQVQVWHRVQVGPCALHGRLRVPEEQRPEAVAQPHLGAGVGLEAYARAPAEGREGTARGPGTALWPASWGAQVSRGPGPSPPPRAIPPLPLVQGLATSLAGDHLTKRTSGLNGCREPGPGYRKYRHLPLPRYRIYCFRPGAPNVNTTAGESPTPPRPLS